MKASDEDKRKRLREQSQARCARLKELGFEDVSEEHEEKVLNSLTRKIHVREE